MADNNNIKNIDDEALEKIIGGMDTQSLQKMTKALYAAHSSDINGLKEDLEGVLDGLLNATKMVQEAIKKNVCPFCNQQIVPGADTSTSSDFVEHVNTYHKTW